MATEKVTAGRDALGAFAPKFAELNDDVLFGQVWSREQLLSPRDRSLITVTALLSSGVLDSSLAFHMQKAKENGLTKTEIAEALTQLAFYSGWPKAWAAFRMALEVWKDGDGQAGAFEPLFPKGAPNDAYAAYFTGRSYLHPLAENPLVCNVTFEPGCRNYWHIHRADAGGGQVLLCTDGQGWYQAWGEPARRLRSGDTVVIPAGVKHWHGAAQDGWFSHLSIEVPGENTSTQWLEPVGDAQYGALESCARPCGGTGQGPDE